MILFQFVGKKRVRNAQNGSRFAQSTVLLDMLVYSNHFIGPYLSPLHRQASGSSYIRLQRAQQLFCGKIGLTVQERRPRCGITRAIPRPFATILPNIYR